MVRLKDSETGWIVALVNLMVLTSCELPHFNRRRGFCNAAEFQHGYLYCAVLPDLTSWTDISLLR